jgi:hypothetical protein
MFDSHCSGSTPACSTAQQKCVECVFDDHCGDSVSEDDDDAETVCGSDQTCHSGVSSLNVISASLILALASLLSM